MQPVLVVQVVKIFQTFSLHFVEIIFDFVENVRQCLFVCQQRKVLGVFTVVGRDQVIDASCRNRVTEIYSEAWKRIRIKNYHDLKKLRVSNKSFKIQRLSYLNKSFVIFKFFCAIRVLWFLSSIFKKNSFLTLTNVANRCVSFHDWTDNQSSNFNGRIYINVVRPFKFDIENLEWK